MAEIFNKIVQKKLSGLNLFVYIYTIIKNNMTDLQFTQEVIKHDAANMDAAEFQQFLEDNAIAHEWNEVTVGDYNDGIYDVYLFDFDMPVRYISGKYAPEED